jgi:hypothetical protein
MAKIANAKATLQDAGDVKAVWQLIPDFKMGTISLDDFTAVHDSADELQKEYAKKDVELTGVRGNRDDKVRQLAELITRFRSGIRSVYGPGASVSSDNRVLGKDHSNLLPNMPRFMSFRPGFSKEEFHESAGVEIKNQRLRPSITAPARSGSRRVLRFTLTWRPSGLAPCPRIRPVRFNASIAARSAESGTSIATGVPLSVTVIVSPLAARLTYRPRCTFRSLIPTVLITLLEGVSSSD